MRIWSILRMQDEQSKDKEMNHGLEDVGYFMADVDQ